jgi:hypothetical protein
MNKLIRIQSVEPWYFIAFQSQNLTFLSISEPLGTSHAVLSQLRVGRVKDSPVPLPSRHVPLFMRIPGDNTIDQNSAE